MNSAIGSWAREESPAEILALDPLLRAQLLSSLREDEALALQWSWASFWARPKQLAPPGLWWTVWLILAGRGFGKTRSVVEWVNGQVEAGIAGRIGIAGATAADVRDVLIEGESGFLAVSPPWNRPVYEPSKRRLTWENGARATLFSADEPDRFRGPQHDLFVADELASWRYPEAWDQAMFGLRLGDRPRAVVATTPRPTELIRGLVKRHGRDVCVTRGSTYDNKANLAPAFIDQIVRKYEGTRLGRQELDGEILDDAPGALWRRAQFEAEGFRIKAGEAPEMKRIVVAVDPAVSAHENSDETGIVVVGLGHDSHAYVLEDATMSRASPGQWGAQVIAVYKRHNANLIVGEVNNGGDLVESNIRAAASAAHIGVKFLQVRASRGKDVRAEPYAALYEQGRVHHVGQFPKLEDQMCGWDPELSEKSPDRIDALVWAMSHISNGMMRRNPMVEALERASGQQ
jgi:phage terminase large subunit-like protein